MTGPNRLLVACVDAHSLIQVTEQEAVQRARDAVGVSWIHLEVVDVEEAKRFLLGTFGFHPLLVEDALSTNERPEVKEIDDDLFLVLPVLRESGEEPEFFELAVFLRTHLMLTVSAKEMPSFSTIIERWEKRPQVAEKEVGMMFHAVLDSVIDGYFPALERLEDRIDLLSDQIFQGDTQRLRELLAVKRDLLEYRRRLSPFRDVANSLMRRDLPVFTPTSRPYIHDAYDGALRLMELVDINRDVLTGLLDVHLSAVSNSLNEVMKKMTVISTVLMTCALIAGIYGMNFDKMPELRWLYGYPFALGLMVVSGLGIIWFFRRKRWI